MIARTYRVYVDLDEETEAREAMEARDVEDLLDEITRSEIHRLLEAEAAMVGGRARPGRVDRPEEDRVTVKLRPTSDDPQVLEVLEDGRKLGEIAPLLKRWQVIDPFEPRTYETREEAAEALRK